MRLSALHHSPPISRQRSWPACSASGHHRHPMDRPVRRKLDRLRHHPPSLTARTGRPSPPAATFLFPQYFLGFPRDLEEAAQLDGAGHWGTFWRVVVPNSLGFIAAIGTITFITSWNAFLWPLVIAQDQNSWTVQIALSTFLPPRPSTSTNCS
jgi:Binding-protein-dependent transport system inner membrane component